MSDPEVDVLRAADRVAVPWRNGAGVTSEVLVSPQDGGTDFSWRLSIATVDSNAVFSTFEGVDRVILALSEHGLDLVHEGESIHLGAFERHAFAGEDSVASANVLAQTLDLNLMTRRGEFSGTLEAYPVSGRLSISVSDAEVVVVVVAQGAVAFGGTLLEELDAIGFSGRAGTSATLSLTGEGQVALARIRSAG